MATPVENIDGELAKIAVVRRAAIVRHAETETRADQLRVRQLTDDLDDLLDRRNAAVKQVSAGNAKPSPSHL